MWRSAKYCGQDEYWFIRNAFAHGRTAYFDCQNRIAVQTAVWCQSDIKIDQNWVKVYTRVQYRFYKHIFAYSAIQNLGR